MGKLWGIILVTFAATGAVIALAAPAAADKDAFAADVLAAGVPADKVLTFQFWAPTACQMAKRMGTSDKDAIAYMQTDVRNNVTITPAQAALIWDSAKRNIC